MKNGEIEKKQQLRKMKKCRKIIEKMKKNKK